MDAVTLAAANAAAKARYGAKGIDLSSGARRPDYIPTFTKYASNPIMTIANQSLTSMAWPCLIEVDDIFGGPGPYGERFRIYYGTDHSTSSTLSGVGLLTAANVLGPWTDRGKVFVDSTGGNQSETPTVIWVPETQTFHLYYHQVGATGATSGEVIKLATMSLATARVGDSWTITSAVPNGILIDTPSWDSHAVQASDGYGYMKPWRVGNRWFATHLSAGTNYGRMSLSISKDGINWRTDPRPLGYHAHLVPSGTQTTLSAGNPLVWNGQRWWLGAIATFTSGGNTVQGVFTIAPVSQDWRRLEAEPTVLFGYSQAWETDTGASPFGPDYIDMRSGASAIVGKDGKIYVVYSGAGAPDPNNGSKAGAGAFGIAVGS